MVERVREVSTSSATLGLTLVTGGSSTPSVVHRYVSQPTYHLDYLSSPSPVNHAASDREGLWAPISSTRAPTSSSRRNAPRIPRFPPNQPSRCLCAVDQRLCSASWCFCTFRPGWDVARRCREGVTGLGADKPPAAATAQAARLRC